LRTAPSLCRCGDPGPVRQKDLPDRTGAAYSGPRPASQPGPDARDRFRGNRWIRSQSGGMPISQGIVPPRFRV